jgi:hypothetical protein
MMIRARQTLTPSLKTKLGMIRQQIFVTSQTCSINGKFSKIYGKLLDALDAMEMKALQPA